MPQLSIGTANFNNSYGIFKKTHLREDEQDQLLQNAWQSGFRYIDTAISYDGVHESLAKLDSFKKNNWQITTKIPKIKIGLSETKVTSLVISIIDEALSILSVDKIDTILIHDNSIVSRMKDLGNILRALDIASNQNLIGSYGLSIYNRLDSKILSEFVKNNKKIVIQGPLSIYDRRLEEYTKNNKYDFKFEGRSIFLQGMILDFKKYLNSFGEDKGLRHFQSWLKLNKISALEACISFAKYSKSDKLIIGFGNINELNEFVNIYDSSIDFKPPIFCRDERILNPLNWR